MVPRSHAKPATALVIAFCGLAAGCAHYPTGGELARTSAPSLPAPYAAVEDGRAEFRSAFCAKLTATPSTGASQADCDDLLWRLDDEAPFVPEPAAPASPTLHDYDVLVVTGALGDCKWKHMLPFGPALERMTAAGVAVHPVVVGGRSSAAHNARQIAAVVRGLDAGRPLIAVGYSKGTVDLLEFLVSEPELAPQVAAVISVGGPVFGSPLAEDADWWYRKLPADALGSFCDPGDGGVFTSLLPEVRRAWMAEHALPAHVRYYSIAGFTTREYLSRGLLLSWEKLADSDRRNDGQVALGDALIPGSRLLALVNADHWDLAIALDEQMPLLSARASDRQFPRDFLFEAALEVVVRALGAPRDLMISSHQPMERAAE